MGTAGAVACGHPVYENVAPFANASAGTRLIQSDLASSLNALAEEGADLFYRGRIGAWRPDRRLGSMLAPTLVVGEGMQMALGSGGSNRIRSAIVQVLAALLSQRISPEMAINAPRLHVESDLLSLEPGLDLADFPTDGLLPSTRQQWTEQSLFFGGVHLVQHFADGRRQAAGDPRRGGAGRIPGH